MAEQTKVFQEVLVEKICPNFSPVDNLPGIWNDPYCVATDDDVDDVYVDPGEGHLPLSQSSLKMYCVLFYFSILCRILTNVNFGRGNLPLFKISLNKITPTHYNLRH